MPSDPTLTNKGFKGITQTKVDPTPIGWVDYDDWRDDRRYWDRNYPLPGCSEPILPPQNIDTSFHLGRPADLPSYYSLFAAYPNPTNSKSSIMIALPKDVTIYLAIINEKYQIVKLLACGGVSAGIHVFRWDLVDEENKRVPAGVYRCIFSVAGDANWNIEYASHGDILVQ
jgi:hypothetical protein